MPVELVFIHGWGFDPHFWDALIERLPNFKHSCVDLGYFDSRKPVPSGRGKILVGHSLGFVHGLRENQDWDGWIAINSFPRFIATKEKIGCTSAAELRDIRMRLQADPAKALQDFYQYIGANPSAGTQNADRLREGLDELRDADIEDAINELNVPGLTLAGRNDPLVPLAVSEVLGRKAKKGGLMLHDSAGHQLPQSQPYWCALMIEAFVLACFD